MSVGEKRPNLLSIFLFFPSSFTQSCTCCFLFVFFSLFSLSPFWHKTVVLRVVEIRVASVICAATPREAGKEKNEEKKQGKALGLTKKRKQKGKKCGDNVDADTDAGTSQIFFFLLTFFSIIDLRETNIVFLFL